jgi:predicted AlkP superfamily phosphohydrolase/phosphomutase
VETLKTKVLVIGLDGSTFKILNQLINEKKVPSIAKKLKTGSSGELEVFYPTLSPLEWASFYTGMNPGNLGDFALAQIGNYEYINDFSSINASYINFPSIWKILSEKGKKVGVINIPATYPPENVNGFLISGFLTPDNAKHYYSPLYLEKDLKDYQIDIGFIMYGLPDQKIDTKKILEEQYQVTENRFKTTLRLISKYNLDFLCINFKGIDNLQHLFWDQYDILSEYYSKVDDYIEKICYVFNPTHIILMSDHGFHEAEKRYFYINSWLEKKKYLYKNKNLKNDIYSKIINIGEKIVSSFKWMRYFIPEGFKQNIVKSYVGKQIDFNKTYMYGSMWGIFIKKNNLKIEYDELVKNIIEELKELIDPFNNKKIFKDIYLKNQIFEGKDLEKFPDIILVPNTDYLINPVITSKIFGDKIDKPYIKGSHKSDNKGILILKGSNIKENYNIKKARITDITPTILKIFDYDKPEYMNGKVLTEIFK